MNNTHLSVERIIEDYTNKEISKKDLATMLPPEVAVKDILPLLVQNNVHITESQFRPTLKKFENEPTLDELHALEHVIDESHILDDDDDKNDTIKNEDDDNGKSYTNINLISIYIKDIGKYKLLTHKEEIELAKQIELGNEDARQQLINSNLRLVFNIAKKYYALYFQSSTTDLLDIVNEGNLGLMKAVEKFNYTLDIKFSTYAYWWIRQSILRYQQINGNIVRIPVRVSEQMRLTNKARNYLIGKYCREPTTNELCKFITENPQYREGSVAKMTPKMLSYYETIYNNANAVSLNAPINNEEDSFLEDFVLADTDHCPEVVVGEKMTEEYIVSIIDRLLKPKSALVVKLRLGIGTYSKSSMTLAEVGCILGSSRERVRQIEERGMKILRNYFGTIRRRNGYSANELL